MIPENLFGTHDFITFLVAGIALNIVPGQDTLYILGRSLAQGRRAGVISVFGLGTGCTIHVMAAALGLYAVLALWPVAFAAIAFLGALYLIWLGISIWLSRKNAGPGFNVPDTQGNGWEIYRQGFLTNLLNPKVALFFLAFLPQFIIPGSGYGPLSFLFLGGTFMLTGTIWCLIIALGAAAFAGILRENSKVQLGFDLFSSLLFIGLGVEIIFVHLL